jgi:hypothetical protein
MDGMGREFSSCKVAKKKQLASLIICFLFPFEMGQRENNITCRNMSFGD